MSLVDFYNEMTQVDDELKKEAAEMNKLAAEEEMAGRFTARGFLDELNKLAQRVPVGMPESGQEAAKRKYQKAVNLQKTFKQKKVSPEAAARLNQAARERVKQALKMREFKKGGLGKSLGRHGRMAREAIGEAVADYGRAGRELGGDVKRFGKGFASGVSETGRRIGTGAKAAGKTVATHAGRLGESFGETLKGYGRVMSGEG